MNWDEGTGGGVSFERQVPGRFPWRLNRSRGIVGPPESKRRVVGPRVKPNGVPLACRQNKPPVSSRRVPERAVRKRRLYLKACLDELERVRNGGEDPILKGNSLADAKKPSPGTLGTSGGQS